MEINYDYAFKQNERKKSRVIFCPNYLMILVPKFKREKKLTIR